MNKDRLTELSKVIHAVNQKYWQTHDVGEGLMRLLDGLAVLRGNVAKRRVANRKAFDKGRILNLFGRAENSYEEHILMTMEDGFADLLLMIADLAAAKSMDFEALKPTFNRNFAEYTFNNNSFSFAKIVMSAVPIRKRIIMMAGYIISWAESEDVDLDYYSTERLKYLQTKSINNGN